MWGSMLLVHSAKDCVCVCVCVCVCELQYTKITGYTDHVLGAGESLAPLRLRLTVEQFHTQLPKFLFRRFSTRFAQLYYHLRTGNTTAYVPSNSKLTSLYPRSQVLAQLPVACSTATPLNCTASDRKLGKGLGAPVTAYESTNAMHYCFTQQCMKIYSKIVACSTGKKQQMLHV